jgi:hypothetical protein
MGNGFLGLAALLLASQEGVAQRRETPSVFLDHVYIVLDSATYAAVSASPILHTLAKVQERSTRVDSTFGWSGTYVSGRSTYLELFGPRGLGLAAGRAGIGFSVVDSGGADRVRRALAQGSSDSVGTLRRTRLLNGVSVPWFDAVGLGRDPDPAVRRWVQEYHPDELRRTGRDSLANGQLVRRRFPLVNYSSALPLEDVDQVVLVLSRDDERRFREEMTAYGWRLASTTHDGKRATQAAGNGVQVLAIASADETPGVRSIRMRLSREWRGPTVTQLGPRSTLTITGTTALWTF